VVSLIVLYSTVDGIAHFFFGGTSIKDCDQLPLTEAPDLDYSLNIEDLQVMYRKL
jgi:hypothetical protein